MTGSAREVAAAPAGRARDGRAGDAAATASPAWPAARARAVTSGASGAALAPGDVRALQRTVGNRAVGDLLARSRGPASPPRPTPAPAGVQRLVGFEVEAHELPMSDAGGAPASRIVSLLGGIPGSSFPAQGGAWHKVADTNSDLRTALLAEARAWRDAATRNRGQIEIPLFAFVPEYVTEPFDEREDESYVTTGACGLRCTGKVVYALDDMRDAMGEIATEIGALRDGYQEFGTVAAGLPPLEDWVAAAEHFGIDEPETFAEASRDRLEAVVTHGRNYVQATVGVLPERLARFIDLAGDQTRFAEGGLDEPLSAQDPLLDNILAYKILGITMQRLNQAAHALVYDDLTAAAGVAAQDEDSDEESLVEAREAGLLTTDDEDEKAALEGVLRLVLYATAGNMLHYTTYRVPGVEKNMFSFFPRTALHTAVKGLPARVSPARMNTVLFAGAFNRVVDKVYGVHAEVGGRVKAALGEAFDLTEAHIDGTAEGSFLGTASARAYIKTVLSGSSDPFHAEHSKGEIAPETEKRGGRVGVATGNRFWRNQNTQPIALELRHAVRKLDAGDLATFAEDVVRLALRAHE